LLDAHDRSTPRASLLPEVAFFVQRFGGTKT
jgi:hypothetical protein